jgi:hypothetical protein
LSRIAQTHIVELEPGSAALGALDLWNQLAPDTSGQGISFVTGRAWQGRQDTETSLSPQTIFENRRPTHVLYRALAYPLTPTPLLIGLDIGSDEHGIRIRGQIAGVSRKHCSIQLRDDKVMLEDLSTYGTFVDEIRVKAGAALQTGQIIRVGTPGETLQLIACLDANET